MQSCVESIQFHWKRLLVLSSYSLLGGLAPCYSQGIPGFGDSFFLGELVSDEILPVLFLFEMLA